MRKYIDADELKKVFRYTEDAEYARWTLEGILGEIDDIEAADVVEVRRGKWIDPEDLTCYKCSVCGEYATQEYGLTEPIFWHYCPNCGALMVNENE